MLTADPTMPGVILRDGKVFATIHPGQGGEEFAADLCRLAREVARRWNGFEQNDGARAEEAGRKFAPWGGEG